MYTKQTLGGGVSLLNVTELVHPLHAHPSGVYENCTFD